MMIMSVIIYYWNYERDFKSVSITSNLFGGPFPRNIIVVMVFPDPAGFRVNML